MSVKKKPTAAVKAELELLDYTCTMTVQHDGDTYAPGELISLTQDQADELFLLGAVLPVKTVAVAVQS